MGKGKINLPSVLTKDTWFYKDRPENQHRLKHLLGQPYISYSSIDSWFNYRADFIKQKFAKIELPQGIYGEFGTWCGEALENGFFSQENPYGFEGQQNMNLKVLRPEGALYEKMVVIECEEYFIIGFIDVWTKGEKGVWCRDQKTGGKLKESKYSDKEYIQLILYAYAEELLGEIIEGIDVYFIRREGSHVRPPLKISKEQFVIPLDYNKERVDFALKKVNQAVEEISDLYTTYLKIFKQ